MARKTIEVAVVVNRVNNMIQSSTDNQPDNDEGRRALCTLLESVLHATDQYAGFKYLFDWTDSTDEYRDANEYARHYYYRGN